MKLVVHPGTGTIIDADECVFLDTDIDLTEEEHELLTGDDYFDDIAICDIAEALGKKLTDLLEGAK